MVSIDSTRRTSLEMKALTYEDAIQPTVNPTGTQDDDKQTTIFTPRFNLKTKTLSILDHWGTTTFMMLLTIYALFGDSFRSMLTSKDSDSIFYIMSVICLFFFILEIILASLVKDDY